MKWVTRERIHLPFATLAIPRRFCTVRYLPFANDRASFYWIAAATSVAMSFIAHEGKVSFECCRPYKPTKRLILGRSRHFLWSPRTRHHVVVWLFRNRYRQFEFKMQVPVGDMIG